MEKLELFALTACIVACVGCEQSFEDFDCADITDEELLAFANSPAVEPEWGWNWYSAQYYSESCVASTDELWQRLDEEQPWSTSYENLFASLAPKYFEVSATGIVEYRALRCDYFDGTTLAGAPFHNTDALIELMQVERYFRRTTGDARTRWYWSNRPAMLESRSQCTSTLCRVRACEVEYAWQRRNMISLSAREAEITVDGRVTLGQERFIREIPVNDTEEASGGFIPPTL